MRHMKVISSNSILPFVEQWRLHEPPVFWVLANVQEDVFRFDAGGPVRRRTDSNILEITFPLSTQFAGEQDEVNLAGELEDTVRRYAVAEDRRDYHAAEGQLPPGVSFELESRVPATERVGGPMLQVLGPGGRATAYSGVRGMTSADITIRRRSKSQNGRWRRLSEILRPLELALGETGDRPTIRTAFGYFELSKYEEQSLMRPVFLFAIEQEQDSEGRWPGYQQIVVTSATTAGTIDESEGLGMWVESIRCSG